MRASLLAVIAMLSLCAQAQTPSPPPPAPPPPSYGEAPSNLAPPAALDITSVAAARGNLDRWRRETKAILAANPSTLPPGIHPSAPFTPMGFDSVGGYFAFSGNASNPPGVVHGTWRPADPLASQSGTVLVTYVTPATICGAPVASAWLPMEQLAWLGTKSRPEFVGLDSALRGGAPPIVEGEASSLKLKFETPPNGAAMAKYYPPGAADRGIRSTVRLACLVGVERNLRCGVVSDGTPGWGFDVAARRVFEEPAVKAAQVLEDGAPSAGRCAVVAVAFVAPERF
jgi:hypothetical protein